MPEEKSQDKKRLGRRDFFKVATGAALGVGVSRIAGNIESTTSVEGKPALISVETPMSNLPFNVKTNLEQKLVKQPVNEQLKKEIVDNPQVENFLKGGGIISTLMTEKHLTSQLTVDQIRAVTDAVNILKGIELPLEPKKGTNESASLDGAIEDLNSSLKLA